MRSLAGLCAFRAAGQSAPLHKETNCHDDYREYYYGLNYIRQRQVLHLPGLFRQFDSVWVFLISFVLFGKDLFQPFCLLFCNPPIHRRGMVAYEELFAATVTSEVPHLLETYCVLSATLLYRHCPHLCSSWVGMLNHAARFNSPHPLAGCERTLSV
jgi:hypothetical protein